MSQNFLRMSFGVVALAIAGCSGAVGGADQLPTHPVTGKVTMNAAPVAGATVTFSPITPKTPPALGVTDAQGVYVLTTYDAGDGAVAGEYKVMISKSAPAAGGGGEPAHDPTGASGTPGTPQHGAAGGAAGGGGGPSSLLPERYASAADTPLAKTVKEGENTIDLAIE